MHQDADHFVLSLQARIKDWITYGKMVHNLSSLGRKAQIFVYFVIEEGADACCAKTKSFGGKVHPLTDSPGFEMNVSITAVTVNSSSIFEISDHGKCHASVPCQVLPQA
jgi:hypothetical protein